MNAVAVAVKCPFPCRSVWPPTNGTGCGTPVEVHAFTAAVCTCVWHVSAQPPFPCVFVDTV